MLPDEATRDQLSKKAIPGRDCARTCPEKTTRSSHKERRGAT